MPRAPPDRADPVQTNPPRILALGLIVGLVGLATSCGGGSGRPAGPPVPVFDTLRTVAGRLSYFTRGPVLTRRVDGRLDPDSVLTEPNLPRSAPLFPFQILAPDGTVLAEDRTDAAGRYSVRINFGPNPATQVRLRVEAQLNLPFGTVFRVLPDRFSGTPYSNQTVLLGDPDSERYDIDLEIALDDAAGAYHILDTLYEGIVKAKAGLLATPPNMDIIWAPGNGAASSLDTTSDPVRLTVAGGIAGLLASNTDEWDEPQLMRMLGEYLLRIFFAEVAPAPTDDATAPLLPSAAWREGFLDWWACEGRNSGEFWDTEGIGAAGRVIRYFKIESFFDPALGSLGPADPNVYQDPANVGLGSRFTVAEVLWDLHDFDAVGVDTGDNDGITFPLAQTIRFLETLDPGESYPWLFTIFDILTNPTVGALSPVQVNIILQFPEDQGFTYPGTPENGHLWPEPIFPEGETPNTPVQIGFNETFEGTVDTLTPDPVNIELGLTSQSYFILQTGGDSRITAQLTVGQDLTVEVLRLDNTLVASGQLQAVTQILPAGRYVIRVRGTTGNPQLEAFTIRVIIGA